MMGAAATANSAEPVTLTFNRTGATASNVTVTVNGAPGASAELTSMSHSMKTSGSAISSAILCPDINGNTSPTITFQLTVSGLPADFSFNNVGLDIHALNGGGSYQEAADGVNRLWNVNVAVGSNNFATLSDIDIAAGVNPGGDRHKQWNATGATTSATSPMNITLTVTKGSDNQGCFFGLSEISLFSDGEEPTPPTPPTPPSGDGNTYTIKWKNNTSSYMCEAADGGIVINSYATDKKIFWELIPTDNEDCYYIRNCVSGLYIGSCNMTPSSASKVKMSATPVEYYIHKSASTSGDNKDCWWMSSTDCANYNKETSGARCLNKDGASSSIITWTTGINNVGSYWTLTESANLYEVCPFKAESAIGSPTNLYQILRDSDGMALTHAMAWAAPSQTDADQKWYFVGTSNAQGGYQIVNASTNAPLNATTYTVHENRNGGFCFIDTAKGDTLVIGGTNALRFCALRSELTRALGIYNLPCGSTGDYWVSSFTADSQGFRYPMPVLSGTSISNPSVTARPSNKYAIVTRDRLAIGNTTICITLNKEPGNDLKMALYFDADGDGIFEETRQLTPAKEIRESIDIKGCPGKRMRLRLNTNGLMGAEDDVVGQVIDFVLKQTDPADDLRMPTVSVNNPGRGTATVNDDDETINATPKGTAAFVCWMIGHRYVSTEATLHVEPSNTPDHYTAIFSPNLDATVGINPAALANKAMGVEMTLEADKTVTVKSKEPVLHLLVFTTDGSLAGMASGADSISLSHLSAGIYVVKAVTESGTATLKIAI